MSEEQVTPAAEDAAPKTESTESASALPGEQEKPSLSDVFEKAISEFEGSDTAESKDDGSAKPKTVDELQEEFGLRRELGVIREWASDVDQERFVQRENEDTAAVIERGSQMVNEFPVPEDYAERFLRSEYNINPALQEAWNNRDDSPEAQKTCEREVEKALGRLHDAARKTPDPELTADRLAVALAVRRGSGKVPEGTPPDYSNMDDKEFQEIRDNLPE